VYAGRGEHRLFARTLGAQIQTGSSLNVCVQSAHVQHTSDTGFLTNRSDFTGQFDMQRLEFGLGTVENTDQINDGIALREMRLQYLWITDISLDQPNIGHDNQLPQPVPVSAQDPQPQAPLGQADNQTLTDESSPP
jgi:hypothetical protein